jgi:YgiT-type zinc finger domain-containing protein
MFERGLSKDLVKSAIACGEIIVEYPDDRPYPSVLVLGFPNGIPVHAVIAEGPGTDRCTVCDGIPTRSGSVVQRRQDAEAMMQCVICKQGETELGLATVALERGGAVVVIKGVPAEICTNCGEYYLDESMTERVLLMAERAVAEGAEIEVRRFAA